MGMNPRLTPKGYRTDSLGLGQHSLAYC